MMCYDYGSKLSELSRLLLMEHVSMVTQSTNNIEISCQLQQYHFLTVFPSMYSYFGPAEHMQKYRTKTGLSEGFATFNSLLIHQRRK